MFQHLTMMLATVMVCGQSLVAVMSVNAMATEAVWTPGPTLPEPRWQHQSLALGNGGVMVMGGSGSSGAAVRTALLSTSSLAGWTLSRTFDRVNVSACVLASGRVLVTGGRRDDAGDVKSSVCELYDPASGTWTRVGALHVGRYLHVVEALADGGAVVIGGISDATDPMDPGNDHIAYENPIERYDPVLRSWTALPTIAPGARPASAVLTDGRVLVMGGFRGMDSGSLNAGGWLYDPANDSAIAVAPWSDAGNWIDFALTALPAGRALRAGGIAYYDPSSSTTATAEIFDVTANAWTQTGALPMARAGRALASLADGRVMDTDGPDTAVYDPAAGSWTSAPARPMPTAAGTLTRLHDGRMIAIGGMADSVATAATWILGLPAIEPPTPPAASTGSATGSGSTATVPATASVGSSGHGCGMGGAIAIIAMAIACGLRTRPRGAVIQVPDRASGIRTS